MYLFISNIKGQDNYPSTAIEDYAVKLCPCNVENCKNQTRCSKYVMPQYRLVPIFSA
jgi:hypothetical protein